MPGMQVVVAPDGSLRVQQGQSAIRATGTPSGYAPIYGEGGLFGICGIDPVLINACVGPMGIEGALRWRGSNILHPMYDALTRISSSGYGQSGDCADCGKPSLKECVQTAVWGRICQMTNEHAFDQLGMFMNEGVNRVALFGNITAPDGTVLWGQGEEVQDRFTLELIAVAYNLRRAIGRMLWTGNPNNTNGGYWECDGFERLISTGKADALTETLCPGLDSYIRDYGDAVVGVAGAPNIVRELSGLIRTINYRIDGAGMNSDSADTIIVMHPRHWDIIANIWYCDYGIICQNTGATNNYDALALAERRDELLRSRMLPIDGKRYPVILDNLMTNSPSPYGSSTKFCGDIFVITRSVDGETVTWGEYQDFSRTTAPEIAYWRANYGNQPISITDGGRFMHAPTTSGGFCFDARVLNKPRLIMKMPWTSGRLDNVCTLPIGEYADVTGSDGLYELDGGIYSKPYMGLYGDGLPGVGGQVNWSGH